MRPILVALLSIGLSAPAFGQDGPSSPGGACPEGTTSAGLADRLAAARSRYADLELEGFARAVDQARALLPCISDPLSPDLAAEYHRMDGLRAFVDQAPERSTRAFAAARSVEPGWRFPLTIAPEGHPVRAEYDAIDLQKGTWEPVPPPARGYVRLDGRRAEERPTSWPTILQRFDDEGAVLQTVRLDVSDPLPSWEVAPEPVALPEPASGGRPVRRAALVGAAGGLVASGVLYGVASRQLGVYNDPDTDPARLDALKGQVNGLVLGSGVTAGAALALGTGALLTGSF